MPSSKYVQRLRLRVFVRDDYRCRLCGGPFAPHVPDNMCYPGRIGPLAGNMDHIIPVSHGGPRSMWNLRSTHQDCNVRRANVIDPLLDYRHLTENGAFGPRHPHQMPRSRRWTNDHIISYLITLGYPDLVQASGSS